jgi:hypothetical protein
MPLRYWTLGDKAHWIRIVPNEITGRRIWNHTPRAAAVDDRRRSRRCDANT